MQDVEELSLRDHLAQLMPEGGRARRLLGLGVVAWSAIGGAVLLWVLGKILGRLAGIFPYLVVAGVVVLLLNPALRRLTRLGVPRRVGATLLFGLAVVLVAVLVALAVPALISQASHLQISSPELIRKGG